MVIIDRKGGNEFRSGSSLIGDEIVDIPTARRRPLTAGND
jgi:hypothetical protein